MIEEFGDRMTAQSPGDFIKRRTDVSRPGGHHCHPQNRQLPVFQGIDLRDRNVETIAYSILDALDYLALVFEASRFSQEQTNTQRSDNHFAFTNYSVRWTCSIR